MTTQHPAHASADLDVTILGAGHIGILRIALLLKQAGGYRLTVADRDPRAWPRPQPWRAHPVVRMSPACKRRCRAVLPS